MDRKKVCKESAEKYVNYYLTKYKIDDTKQPNLKNAIIELCENPELTISPESINVDDSKEGRTCVKNLNNYTCLEISRINSKFESMFDLIEDIISKIMDLENKELLAIRIFCLETKLKSLAEEIEDIKSIHAVYRS